MSPMRLFKKRSPSPPQLVRLALLPAGLEEEVEGRPTNAGLRLSLPSNLSQCNVDDLMAYPASPFGAPTTPRSRRGFPFPWIGRKNSAPKKYAVNPSVYHRRAADDDDSSSDISSSLLRPAVSQLSLDDYTNQLPRSLKTFRKILPKNNDRFSGYVRGDNLFVSSESLNNNNNNNNNDEKFSMASTGVMYRSVSTSALLEDSKDFCQLETVIPNNRHTNVSSKPSPASLRHLPLKTVSCEDLIEDCSPLEGGSFQMPKNVSHLGTVVEEEVFLDGLARCSGDFDTNQNVSRNPAEDTESLASSIQHRSDESGYESDGTKNGSDETGIADKLRDSVISESLSFSDIEPDFTSVKRVMCTSPLEKHSDTNLQKFASLFQRFTSGTLNSPRTNSFAELPREGEITPKQITKSYEIRSLRLRTPTILSSLVQRSKDSSPSSVNRVEKPQSYSKEQQKSSTEEMKKDTRNNSRLGQFKAWTLDRKLLRSRWKKGNISEEKLDIPAATKRSSIFQSSLFPSSVEDSPSNLQMETKSLTSLPVNLESISDSESSLKCGDLNYQLRLKKAGYRSASTANDARRRLWLQSQLSVTSDENDNIFHTENVPCNKNFVTSSIENPRRIPSQLDLHEIVSVDLEKDKQGELGIYITGCYDSEKNVLGYIIVDFEKGGPAERSKKLLKGDELLIVNGQQLQGVGLEEARQLLRVPDREVHLLVARELSEELCCNDSVSRLPSSLPPVPEMQESTTQSESSKPRLRHWQSDTSCTNKVDNRHSHPDLPPKPKADNERIGSNGICTLPRRPKPSQLSLHTVVFEKGPGRKSLGFSIVGGKDSPKGELGFYVKTIFPNGQAAESGYLKEGDEIYTLNGQSLQGLSHSEAIAAFKKIKQGPVVLHIGRRTSKKCSSLARSSGKFENNSSVSKSCSRLDSLS